MLFKTAIALVLLTSTAAMADNLRPSFVHWGASLSNIQAALHDRCSAITLHNVNPPDISGARVQTELDCEGFTFQQKTGHAEFVFGNGELKMVRISTDAGDEGGLKTAMTAEYGAPDHSDSAYDSYASGGAMLRHDKHQLIFYAAEIAPEL
jgi:hypothetical protein